jgi:hypothetical protein
MAVSLRSPFSPAHPSRRRDAAFSQVSPPNPGRLFHPPDPPIAVQSITRDEPFSQVAMASTHWSIQARSLFFPIEMD